MRCVAAPLATPQRRQQFADRPLIRLASIHDRRDRSRPATEKYTMRVFEHLPAANKRPRPDCRCGKKMTATASGPPDNTTHKFEFINAKGAVTNCG